MTYTSENLQLDASKFYKDDFLNSEETYYEFALTRNGIFGAHDLNKDAIGAEFKITDTGKVDLKTIINT